MFEHMPATSGGNAHSASVPSHVHPLEQFQECVSPQTFLWAYAPDIKEHAVVSHETLARYLVQGHQRDLLAAAKRERLKNEVHEESPQQVKQLPWLTSLLSSFRRADRRKVPACECGYSTPHSSLSSYEWL